MRKNAILNAREIELLARREEITPAELRAGLESGQITVVRNRGGRPLAIGAGCYVKVNANIGTSPARPEVKAELEKLRAVEAAGADAVMDLSTGGDLARVRREIMAASRIPVGSVPVYGAMVNAVRKYKAVQKMSAEALWEQIEAEAAGGVAFMTVHTGVSERIVRGLADGERLINIVSRGGSLLACWIAANRRENPLLEDFGRLVKIAARYGTALSLGDGLRPGAVADSTDRFQIEELLTLGRQAAEARRAGVPVLIEGPGHIPLHQVEMNVKLAKQVCHGAPLYLLGPLVTDFAPGYDHIVSAIGGALAAMAGADFLCYVTPSEHLGLPGVKEVREGVYTARIAAHAADLARGKPGALERDLRISSARRDRDWAGQKRWALNPEKVAEAVGTESDFCSMCGEFCSMRFSEKLSPAKRKRKNG